MHTGYRVLYGLTTCKRKYAPISWGHEAGGTLNPWGAVPVRCTIGSRILGMVRSPNGKLSFNHQRAQLYTFML